MSMSNVSSLEPRELNPARESLGQRLRRMRMAKGWRLSELAERTGIATSTLSKVENDHLSLNYDRLMQIAHGFELSLSEFLADGAEHGGSPARSQASGRMCVERRAERRGLATQNYLTEYLCTRMRQKSMAPTVAVVKAGNLQEFGPLLRHDGEEFIYVLKGSIQLHTEFYGPETLHKGDSAYFDSTMGHGYTRFGEDEATILCIMSGEGDFTPG